MPDSSVSRRDFARASAILATGFAAGCLGTDDDDIPDPDQEPSGDSDDGGNGNGNGDGADVDSWLEDAPNYDGNVEDMTGEDSVQVGVGDPEGGSNFMMDPAAITVDSGTTVTWEWIDGDSHSVTHENGSAFDSEIQQGEGNTFEYQFDEAGTFLYYCIPHETLGQKGAVIVE